MKVFSQAVSLKFGAPLNQESFVFRLYCCRIITKVFIVPQFDGYLH